MDFQCAVNNVLQVFTYIQIDKKNLSIFVSNLSVGEMHKTECSILSKADFEADIEDFNENDDHYACIMPLRFHWGFKMLCIINIFYLES